MEFKARPITENVNISKGSRLWDLLLLTGGVLGGLVLLFLVAGLLVDVAVGHIPVSWEARLGLQMEKSMELTEDERLTKILDKLVATLDEKDPNAQRNFRIALLETDQINAVALPGDLIVIFSGLLDNAESENELAMIIGHEMGHFAHRDHLTRLGRALVFGVASRLVLGDAVASRLTAFFSDTLHAGYSRTQESAADAYGIQRLALAYGHVGGSLAFFQRVAAMDKSGKLAYLTASHPHPESRLEALKALTLQNGWSKGELTPLPAPPN